MTNEQLAEALTTHHLVNEEVVRRLKKEATLSSRSIEELLYERNLVDTNKFAEVKSTLVGVPHIKVDVDALEKDVLTLVPEETVRNYAIVPLKQEGNQLVVGMVYPDNPKAREALQFIGREMQRDVAVYLISYDDWQDALRKYSPYKSDVEAAVQAFSLKPGERQRRFVELEEHRGEAEEAPIITIVADTFREAVQRGASDVHIEPQQNYLRIRLRIDGQLHEEASLPLELTGPVISRVKVISNLKIDETRIPQDGRFRTRTLGRAIDFRVSTFPTPLGEKVAIRVLDPATGLKSFDQLGLSEHNITVLRTALAKPFGMIIISGPTGSGKTTTLYALLQELNNEGVNIVSLEDPVEYFVPGVNQSQVRPEIGYDFASGLRQILRQDPDIIMVGEIRDNETAGLAVHASLTGHIVLSTIHTNNAAGVIPRLIDMQVEPFLLPSALNLMMGQRLVSVLCKECRKDARAPKSAEAVITKALAALPQTVRASYTPPYTIYHSEGCAACGGKGITGRIALFEVFEMTPELGGVTGGGNPTINDIVKEAHRQGMVSLRQDGVLKALRGVVTIEEVVRETTDV